MIIILWICLAIISILFLILFASHHHEIDEIKSELKYKDTQINDLTKMIHSLMKCLSLRCKNGCRWVTCRNYDCEIEINPDSDKFKLLLDYLDLEIKNPENKLIIVKKQKTKS